MATKKQLQAREHLKKFDWLDVEEILQSALTDWKKSNPTRYDTIKGLENDQEIIKSVMLNHKQAIEELQDKNLTQDEFFKRVYAYIDSFFVIATEKDAGLMSPDHVKLLHDLSKREIFSLNGVFYPEDIRDRANLDWKPSDPNSPLVRYTATIEEQFFTKPADKISELLYGKNLGDPGLKDDLIKIGKTLAEYNREAIDLEKKI